MNKEKVKSLTKYLEDLKNRLNSDIPEKHKNRPEQFKAFLQREIKLTQITITKLTGAVQ